MQQIAIPLSMLEKARLKAQEMGRLHNSITRGQGNIAGFIGEEVARSVLGGDENNTYDYDLITESGMRVDVKTKRTGFEPKDHYECSVAAFNTKQDCDMYAFVRVHNDLHTAWFLGVYPKKDYFNDAVFLKKGDVDPSNNFKVKADCYNMAIKDLQSEYERS